MIKKKWEIQPRKEDLFAGLLLNRGLKTKAEINLFLHPALNNLQDPEKFPEMGKAVDRVLEAIKKEEPVIIYGDFDVDGITGTAILWEVLYFLGAKVTPYIPHRVSEGYGLHKDAIEKFSQEGVKVVISVDCGITAVEEAKLAKKLGIDLIITDHHHPGSEVPKSFALVHTEELAGAGVSFKLAWAFLKKADPDFSLDKLTSFIDLAAIGTIADMVPLLGENRIIAAFGLEAVKETQRLGLAALLEEAAVKIENLRVYDISFIIAPRLNAMGRLESAMDSLRILLTKNPERARELAQRLSFTNQERQRILAENLLHAQGLARSKENQKIIVLAHESYVQGVVGLVAGRVLEETGKPTIVIAIDKDKGKGSARSVQGLSIVEAIASCSDLLIAHGGHHMAAGLTIATENIPAFTEKLNLYVDEKLKGIELTPVLKIEAELKPEEITLDLFDQLEVFKPFGIGNPEPMFMVKELEVLEKKLVGKTGNHLKLALRSSSKIPHVFEAIGFGLGAEEIEVGDKVDLAFNLTEDNWRERKLVLKIKDFRK